MLRDIGHWGQERKPARIDVLWMAKVCAYIIYTYTYIHRNVYRLQWILPAIIFRDILLVRPFLLASLIQIHQEIPWLPLVQKNIVESSCVLGSKLPFFPYNRAWPSTQ